MTLWERDAHSERLLGSGLTRIVQQEIWTDRLWLRMSYTLIVRYPGWPGTGGSRGERYSTLSCGLRGCPFVKSYNAWVAIDNGTCIPSMKRILCFGLKLKFKTYSYRPIRHLTKTYFNRKYWILLELLPSQKRPPETDTSKSATLDCPYQLYSCLTVSKVQEILFQYLCFYWCIKHICYISKC